MGETMMKSFAKPKAKEVGPNPKVVMTMTVEYEIYGGQNEKHVMEYAERLVEEARSYGYVKEAKLELPPLPARTITIYKE